MKRLTPERLSELESDALSTIKYKGRYVPYMLINSTELLSMITEIRNLRKEVDPEALVAAFMAGAESNKKEK